MLNLSIEQTKALSRARSIYGMESQNIILIQECCELVVAITDYLRGRCGVEMVAEEIADVSICCESFSRHERIEDRVRTLADLKLTRLRDQLKDT